MVDLCVTIYIVQLSINGLNTAVKRQRVSELKMRG